MWWGVVGCGVIIPRDGNSAAISDNKVVGSSGTKKSDYGNLFNRWGLFFFI